MIKLTDGKEKRFVVLLGITGKNLRPHFHSVLSVDKHYAGIGHPESRYQTANEIVGAGSINEIQFVILVFRVE